MTDFNSPRDGARTLSRRAWLAAVGAGLASASCRAADARARLSREPAQNAPPPSEQAPIATPPEPRREAIAPLVYDEHGGLFIEAHIAGRSRVRMILDTGASRSTISTRYAGLLGIELREGQPIEGSAGVVASRNAQARIEVPGLARQVIDFAVYDFQSYDEHCVGILGYEFLSQAPFRIHYRERTLVWNAPPSRRTIPLVLEGRIPKIVGRINGVDADLRIDTGAAFPPGEDAYLNLTQDQAARFGLTGAPLQVFTATGTGGATLELPVHALGSLEIAGVVLPRAFAIVQPRVGYFAREDAIGFIGNSVLDKLDPYFDYEGGVFGVAG